MILEIQKKLSEPFQCLWPIFLQNKKKEVTDEFELDNWSRKIVIKKGSKMFQFFTFFFPPCLLSSLNRNALKNFFLLYVLELEHFCARTCVIELFWLTYMISIEGSTYCQVWCLWEKQASQVQHLSLKCSFFSWQANKSLGYKQLSVASTLAY